MTMNDLNQVREQLQSAIESLDKVMGLYNPAEYWRYELINRPDEQVDYSSATNPIKSSLRGFVDYDPHTDKFFRFEFVVTRMGEHKVQWQLGDGQENAGVLVEGSVDHDDNKLCLQGGFDESSFRLHVGKNVLHWGIIRSQVTVYNCYLEGFKEVLWNRTSGYNHAGFGIGQRVN